MDDEPHSPGVDHAFDARANAENLDAHADAVTDATWADQEVGRHVVPGIVSGDLGPKGRVSAQLRDLSRRERSSYGEVPRGTTHGDGGFRYVLLPMLAIAFVLLLVVALIMWIAS